MPFRRAMRPCSTSPPGPRTLSRLAQPSARRTKTGLKFTKFMGRGAFFVNLWKVRARAAAMEASDVIDDQQNHKRPAVGKPPEPPLGSVDALRQPPAEGLGDEG